MQGDHAAAVELLQQARIEALSGNLLMHEPFILLMLAHSQADAGDPAAGLATASTARAIARDQMPYHLPEATRLNGELLLATGGDPAAAIALLDDAARIAVQQGNLVYELRAAPRCCGRFVATTQAPRLDRCAPSVQCVTASQSRASCPRSSPLATSWAAPDPVPGRGQNAPRTPGERAPVHAWRHGLNHIVQAVDLAMTARDTNSAVLRARLEPALPSLRQVAAELGTHPEFRAIYPALLHLEHTIVRASLALLHVAAQEAIRRAASGDLVAHDLSLYLRHHARNESHHADWLLEDYAILDLDPTDMLERPPSATVAAMVGATYYWILHYHPVAVTGYLAATIVSAPTPQLIDELQQRTGHPAAAFRTLAHHAETDPQRGDALWELLDRLTLAPPHLEVVVGAGKHTLDLHGAALAQLLEDPPEDGCTRSIRHEGNSANSARASAQLCVLTEQNHRARVTSRAADHTTI